MKGTVNINQSVVQDEEEGWGEDDANVGNGDSFRYSIAVGPGWIGLQFNNTKECKGVYVEDFLKTPCSSTSLI